jgi:hypothetical protein
LKIKRLEPGLPKRPGKNCELRICFKLQPESGAFPARPLRNDISDYQIPIADLLGYYQASLLTDQLEIGNWQSAMFLVHVVGLAPTKSLQTPDLQSGAFAAQPQCKIKFIMLKN